MAAQQHLYSGLASLQTIPFLHGNWLTHPHGQCAGLRLGRYSVILYEYQLVFIFYV